MIELTDEMRTRLSNALNDGFPVVAASVEPDGYPKLSFYGSTQVYSEDQLAIWHRSPEGGLIDRLGDNPRMAFMYRHGTDRTFFQFYGRARIDDSAETRERVYANMPEIEKMLDPDKKGRAIIVDVDRVVGRGLEMRRDEAGAHA
jgi:predicted pyridoxine 5'-phosphate oxidase superfamily flavin-nucleotide-binding protein